MNVATRYRGRFAPSPTGDLHLGSAATALIAWLRCRRANGSFVLRVEDIDTPRVVRDCEMQQLDDLHWLGLGWDEGPDVGGPHSPYRQSERTAHYEQALARLASDGLTYLCDCSRKEIAGVASAPHTGEEGPRYPGTCRRYGMEPRAFRRAPAIRLIVPAGMVTAVDALQGEVHQDVEADVGDFVLKRGDGIYAYHLAVVVDDLSMGITEVVRGADLLSSVPRQILLARLLGGPAPAFAHTPLLLEPGGERLAKRNPRNTLRGLRAGGADPRQLLGHLASQLGLVETGAQASVDDLRAVYDDRALSGRRELRLSG